MELIKWFLTLLIIVKYCALDAKTTSIRIDDRKDYEILDLFFKMGVQEEEYGYVLEGIKPISARQFYPLDTFPMKDFSYSENEFKKTLLVRETIQVWSKLCTQQDNFVLKALPVIENEAEACGYEVQFIHMGKLCEVIGENIDLFKYILGPCVEADELVNRIAHSNERLTDILKDNPTLIGIVLGFGSNNSIMGGRLETIDRLSISKDIPPYLPKSGYLQTDSLWMYGMYYLEYAGGKDTFFRQTDQMLLPNSGFTTIQEEINALESKMERLPERLYQQPRFIFNAFKGNLSNQSLFHALQKAQTRSKCLLQKESPLIKILSTIGGKKPKITCPSVSEKGTIYSLIDEPANLWTCILKGVLKRFDADDQLVFKKAIQENSVSATIPPMMGATKEMLQGLQKARNNLTAAQAQCSLLSEDPALEVIIPDQLYIKTLQEGRGERIECVNSLRIKYTIEDSSNNILFAHHDTWINLLETIPGFVHGLQGMRIGEQRTLYIHPALGYGAFTTLPPCALLIVSVQLLDVEACSKITLPPIKPLKFDWLQDEKLYHAIEESLILLPKYIGAFYKSLFKQFFPDENSDKEAA